MTIRRRFAAPALAIALGAMTVLGFAPFGLWPLVLPALAGLFYLAENQRPRRAFWLGWLFGAAEFVIGVYWIYISIHLVGDAAIWIAVSMLILLVAAMGVFSATVLWAAAYLAPARGWLRYLVVLPSLWALLEWVRSWILSGFPWLSVGYSQVASPLAGFAPVAGVFGLGWVVAATAGLLVLVALPFGAGAPARVFWRRRGVAIGVLLVLFGAGFALRAVDWTRPAGPPLKVSLIQGNIKQSIKWNPATFAASLKRYRKLTLAHLDSDLIIWPETAIPEWLGDIAERYLLPLADQVAARGGQLALGVPVYRPRTKAAYNGVVLLDGKQPQFYFKQHLVPFGEYFPGPDWFRAWLKSQGLPYSGFTSGRADQKPLNLGRLQAAVAICYEDAFGAQLMRMLPAANLLINVSNDAWFGDSVALPQHLQIAQMRSIEAGRVTLRVTNTGITAIIGPGGAVRERLPLDEAGVLTDRVRPYTGATPYALTGDWPVVLALLGALASGIVARIIQRRQKKDRV